MLRSVRRASSRAAARVAGSRFAKPVARVVLAAAGLLLLAFIGKAAAAGALGPAASSAPSVAALATAAVPPPPASAPAPVADPAPAPSPSPPPPSPSAPAPASRTQATADDPVILNTANVDDLRRLPGIGEKRANAIVALRARLGGRFRAVDDLLKVKGIGRTTLKRLRPLVRLDPPVSTDAGVPP
jgi:competence protein ComEA